MNSDGRNTLPGIASRVRTNLAFMTFSRNMGADVHVVTQLLLSLLGLIVFPFEELRRANPKTLQHIALTALAEGGWPVWTFSIGSSPNLGDLLFHLRNAISHRRLVFSSDSRLLEEVMITFRDCKTPEGPVYWEAHIGAKELHAFVELLYELFADRGYMP